MSTTDDLLPLVERHLQELATRFSHPQWEGIMLSTPEQTAQIQAANGRPVWARWEVWVEQPRVPNSRNPSVMNGGVRAAIAFESAEDLLATPVEGIARRLTLAIAGQAAHEALEWLRFDGELVVDPHGELEALQDAAVGIAEYLLTAGH